MDKYRCNDIVIQASKVFADTGRHFSSGINALLMLENANFSANCLGQALCIRKRLGFIPGTVKCYQKNTSPLYEFRR